MKVNKDQKDYLHSKEYIERRGKNQGMYIKRFEVSFGEIIGFIDFGIAPTGRGIINIVGRITCAEDIDEIANVLFLIDLDYQTVLSLSDNFISC